MAVLKVDEIGIKLPIYVVRRESPALTALKRVCAQWKPGAVIPVTNEEFDSLKEDVIRLRSQ